MLKTKENLCGLKMKLKVPLDYKPPSPLALGPMVLK